MLHNVLEFDEEDYQCIFEILLSNLEKDDVQATTDRDYYGTAINSLNGTALIALIRLGLKIGDSNNNIIEHIRKKIFELLSQKNKIIYSVIGRYYPWMQYIVKDRLEKLRTSLFNKKDTELFFASFGSYLYNRLYFSLFDELKEYYLFAIQNDMFVENGNLSYIGGSLGDHLGILLYQKMIKKDDEIGKALLNSPQLLRRAIWWIISSLTNDKIEDRKISDDLKDVWDSILTCVRLGIERYKNVFDSFTMLLDSSYFKEDEKWMISTTISLLQNRCIESKFWGREIYKNFADAAQKEDLYNDIIDFLEIYLIKPEYDEKYSPESFKCPYNSDSYEINQIFKALLEGNLDKAQKDRLYNIFNTLSNYGFYHRVEKFIEQVRNHA